MTDKIMTPGMQAEGISSEEMEEIYQWSKKLEKEMKEKGLI